MRIDMIHDDMVGMIGWVDTHRDVLTSLVELPQGTISFVPKYSKTAVFANLVQF
jgi:hypothetical protein